MLCILILEKYILYITIREIIQILMLSQIFEIRME